MPDSFPTGARAAPGLPLLFYPAPLIGFAEVHLAPGGPFTAVEVQQLDLGGDSTVLVAAHRPDRALDVFVPEGSGLDREWARRDPFLAHLRLASFVEVPFRRRHCVISADVVEVDVAVEGGDLAGELAVSIDHRFGGPGRPSFVPAVAGQRRPVTMRFMHAGCLRPLPRRAAPTVTLAGRVLPVATRGIGPIGFGPSTRIGAEIVGVGLNRTGVVAAPLGSTIDPFVTATPTMAIGPAAGRLRMTLRDAAGDTVGVPPSDGAPVEGRFTVEGHLGEVARGGWSAEPVADGWALTLTDVEQSWFPGWADPVRLGRYLLRRRRRAGESWCWTGRAVTADGGFRHEGAWSTAARSAASSSAG
ncbi:MAG: hypothetical protein AAF547_15170 [Actinomycetota bacterium]